MNAWTGGYTAAKHRKHFDLRLLVPMSIIFWPTNRKPNENLLEHCRESNLYYFTQKYQ